MKNRMLIFLCFLIMFLILPVRVLANVSYKGDLVSNYKDTDDLKVYVYDLKIVFSGNHSINHLEGYLRLTNLQLVSFVPHSAFTSTFDKGSLKYNMTSKTMFTSDFTYATVTVKQVNPMLDCKFEYEPTVTSKVNINEFTLKKDAYKDGKIVTQVKQGEEFQYKITVTSNNNALETDEVTLTDEIPSELEIISTSPVGSVRGNTITWNLGKFKAGTETREFIVNVRAKKDIKGKVNNVAVLEVGDKKVQDDAPVTITYSEITIVKKASRNIITEGMEFYYTIEVRNIGNATSDNVVVEDTLDSNLEFVKASVNHTVSNGKYIFNLGTIGANQMKTIRIDVKAKSSISVKTIPNTAIAKEGDKPPVEDDVDVEVKKEEVKPDIKISKSVSATKVKAGEEFKYTITVVNGNELNLIDLKLTDKFDNHLIIVDAENGTINSDNSVTWIFDLGPNETKNFVVTVKAKNYEGVVKNSAVISYEDKDITSNEVVVEIEEDPEIPPEKPEDPVEPGKPGTLPPDDPNDIPNPQTGNVFTFVILAVSVLISLLILYLVKHKKKLYRI